MCSSNIKENKIYKIKNVKMSFSWYVTAAKENENNSYIRVTYIQTLYDNSFVLKEFIRSVAQIEKFYIPLVRIALGIDSISHTMLYINEPFAKDVIFRIIENGISFLTVKGIRINKDDSWVIINV